MDTIQFSLQDLSIQYHATTITLLPKEFQLLQYLYHSPSIVFSREQLLHAVWPHETPIDRTVDDHIYRIRKKLLPLDEVLAIETVRGQGYVLIVKKTRIRPLANDQQISLHVQELFAKYHQYGQGDALKLLQQNQELLGFELDVSNLFYLHFMQGNFSWFLQAPYSFSDKAFYLLHIFALVEPNKQLCLQYFYELLQMPDIPAIHRIEIELLNINLLLIYTKQFDAAEQGIAAAKKDIMKQQYDGFIPLILLMECLLALAKNDLSRVEELQQEIKEVLGQYPFLREHAHFIFLQGITSMQDDEAAAHKFFSEGFHLLQQSPFIPGIFMNCSLIIFFIELWDLSPKLLQLFEHQFMHLTEQYQLNIVHEQLQQIFSQYL